MNAYVDFQSSFVDNLTRYLASDQSSNNLKVLEKAFRELRDEFTAEVTWDEFLENRLPELEEWGPGTITLKEEVEEARPILEQMFGDLNPFN